MLKRRRERGGGKDRGIDTKAAACWAECVGREDEGVGDEIERTNNVAGGEK